MILRDLTLAELEEICAAQGQPAFRAKQVFLWLSRAIGQPGELRNLPRDFRERLLAEYPLTAPKLRRRQVSRRDGTKKYLWALADGSTVESVLMQYRYGNSLCLSTQVGCRMGCAFCASTLGGRLRNLSAGEMLEQVIFSQEDAGAPVSHLVLMGIGEPLDNYDNVLRFLRLVNHPQGLGLSMRHISLSTCGLVPEILRLAEERLQLTLSVSLHAPDDETRSRLMPINRRYGVDDLLAACRAYFARTGRRISFEYALIDGVNDSPEQAALLAKKLARSGAHVNLIALNHVAETGLAPSRRVGEFQKELSGRGVKVTLRRRLGSDIDASCGQLRRKTQLAEPEEGGIHHDQCMGRNG